MRFRLLLFALVLGLTASAQQNLFWVKKRGIKKVDTYYEGSPIRIRASFGYLDGVITRIGTDSIFINTLPVAFADIREIILRRKRKENLGQQLLLTGAGIALTTAGMTLAKWTDWKTALATGTAIGAANYAPRIFTLFKRKRYRVGRKFTLQPLELRMMPRPA